MRESQAVESVKSIRSSYKKFGDSKIAMEDSKIYFNLMRKKR